MWLGRCWVCHVGDTATNMTLALWMWNNTWQAELLISNHLLSWYASESVVQLFCTTLSLHFGSSPRQMLSIGEKSLLPLMHSSKNCPTESDSRFLRLFLNLRAVGAHFKQFLLNTRLQFVQSVAVVHLFFLADLFSVTWAHFGDMSYVKGWAAADVISNHPVSNRAKRMMFLLGSCYCLIINVLNIKH